MQSRDKSVRPSCALPVWEAIPAELKEIPNWVFWRYQWVDGKWTKPPVQVLRTQLADVTNAETWARWSDVQASEPEAFLSTDSADGIGFVLTKETGLVCVDVDNCVKWMDDGHADLDEWATRIVGKLPTTYVEFSPSRTGIHVWIKAQIRQSVRYDPGGVEIYDSARYITVTGDVWNDAPIAEASAEIGEIVAALLALRQQNRPAPQSHEVPVNIPDVSIEERIRVAFASANGEKIRRLFEGDLRGYEDSSEDGFDRSAADMALCRHLCYYSSGDPEILKALMRSSQMPRPEREGYLDTTVRKTLETHDGNYWEPAVRIRGGATPPALSAEASGRVARYTASELKERAIAYRQRADLKGLSAQWENLNRVYRPRPGLLSIWTGEPGAGKSTFILAYVYSFCVRNQLRAALCSFELNPPERLVLELAQIHTQMNPFAAPDEMFALSDEELSKAIDEFSPYFSVLSPDWRERNVDGVCALLQSETVLYLDPFTELQPPDKLLGKYTDFASVELSKLRDYTERMQLITHLVCHPVKNFNRKDRVRLHDINGSGDFERKADFGLVVERDKASGTTILNLDKVRDRLTGEENSQVAFRLDVDHYFFTECAVPLRMTESKAPQSVPAY